MSRNAAKGKKSNHSRRCEVRDSALDIGNILAFLPMSNYLCVELATIAAMNVKSFIVNFANAQKEFRVSDLYECLSGKVDISKKMVSWHLCKLMEEGKIFRIGKGVYTTTPKSVFHPVPNAVCRRLYKQLKAEYPLLDFCVYTGEILSDLQHHLSYNNNIYIEVERSATETIFHFVQDMHARTFLSPNEDMMADYIQFDKRSFIVKPLISESPIQEVKGVYGPRIEKLLVDIQCDKDFFYLQGQESMYVVQNAFASYTVNVGMLLRYASRRNAKLNVKRQIEAIA